MIRLFTIFCFCLGATFLMAQQDQKKGPKIEFETEVLNYGKVLKGSSGTRYFKFTNTGDAPLEFKSAEGSCGCTVPKIPAEAILPGQKGTLAVTYDTTRMNRFSKSVTIVTNASPEPMTLRIKGEVYE